MSDNSKHDTEASHNGDAEPQKTAGADASGEASNAGTSGRERENQVELRFLIASKTAGAVIGKGGANIKRLREAYHARIIVPDSDGPDRVVTVECTRETVRELLTELFQALLDDEKRNAAQAGSSAPAENPPLTEADARLLIHQSQAGCLIGKEGAKIKQLRTELALRVFKIFPECCPRSTERVVQMLGEPRAIVDAVVAVEQLLAANPPKGPRVAYNPGMVEAMQNAYGGWPVPYGASFGAQPGFPPANHGPMPRRGGFPPGAARRGGSARGGAAAAAAAAAAPPFRGPPVAGAAPVYGGFDFFSNNAVYTQFAHGTHEGGLVSTQVSLPDRLTGCIMGRGGQRIQQIRSESGAEIRVDNPQSGRDRIITLRGTPHQIQTAQFLLQQCVRKFGGMGY